MGGAWSAAHFVDVKQNDRSCLKVSVSVQAFILSILGSYIGLSETTAG